MTTILVMDAAKKLNFFPAKQGISEYYSLRMIMHQKNLDYSKHCKFKFGAYIQTHDEPSPKNNNSAQTLDCIYLSIQTIIKEDMNYYILQAITSLLNET